MVVIPQDGKAPVATWLHTDGPSLVKSWDLVIKWVKQSLYTYIFVNIFKLTSIYFKGLINYILGTEKNPHTLLMVSRPARGEYFRKANADWIFYVLGRRPRRKPRQLLKLLLNRLLFTVSRAGGGGLGLVLVCCPLPPVGREGAMLLLLIVVSIAGCPRPFPPVISDKFSTLVDMLLLLLLLFPRPFPPGWLFPVEGLFRGCLER